MRSPAEPRLSPPPTTSPRLQEHLSACERTSETAWLNIGMARFSFGMRGDSHFGRALHVNISKAVTFLSVWRLRTHATCTP